MKVSRKALETYSSGEEGSLNNEGPLVSKVMKAHKTVVLARFVDDRWLIARRRTLVLVFAGTFNSTEWL